MADHNINNILSLFGAFHSNKKLEIIVQMRDLLQFRGTPPESSPSEAGSLSRCEEHSISLPTQTGPVPPELVSQLCFSTSMNADLHHSWKDHRVKVAASPYDYILTLPSKGIRGAFIDSLNVWLGAPEDKTTVIKEVITMLHNSSLIIDDFQDNSPLRRGKPSTHTVFGPAQAINSATYVIVKAIGEMHEIVNYESLAKMTQMIMTIFQGQAMDLSWTFNKTVPSIQEYLLMVNDTLELLSLNSQSCVSESIMESLSSLVSFMGQYFQIRDDYMNLIDVNYTDQKGFCEDLDEGKYSLTLMHALQSDSTGLLTNVLSMRRLQGSFTREQKTLVLELMKANGSLDWTRLLLSALHDRVLTEIGRLEKMAGKDNTALRALVERLKLET
ncbi:geranylgeranyl diphosphate synthase [Fusarium beomiforme]|uniref:Geranylgeranyl diphosphate synthase n=1 Tax=Fusarium beomiforme TaxID=44412 RepID=A0A9P5AMS2_9HYPO|nr:geranylgeranyl diphosphate synthase [Fusarium beomiforme]